MKAARRQSVDAQQAVASGIDVSARGLGATASALDAELAWTTATDSASDAEAELRSALALPPGTRLELVVPESQRDSLLALDGYVATALAASPDVAAAAAGVERAHRASALARADYIPDIGVGLSYTMIDGISFLPRHAVGLSIQGSWTVFDWGKRGSLSRERAAQESGAAIGLAQARDRVAVEVERAYRFVARAQRSAEVARAAVEARRATVSVIRDRYQHGLVSQAALSTAEAELADSEARVMAAEMQIRVARAGLTRAIGG
jgi:outer membrane protein TolC